MHEHFIVILMNNYFHGQALRLYKCFDAQTEVATNSHSQSMSISRAADMPTGTSLSSGESPAETKGKGKGKSKNKTKQEPDPKRQPKPKTPEQVCRGAARLIYAYTIDMCIHY